MNVLFVRPHLFDGRASDALEPLAFAVLAGATPRDVDLTLHDERLAPVPLDAVADLVAISVETYTARRAYQIAREFRARGIPVVAGGYHPTFLPDEALRHVDAVVAGDAESVWPLVLRDARQRRLQRLYRAVREPSLEDVAYDRRIFAGMRYPNIASVQVGRGCRYACDFCSIHSFYDSRVRYRPVEAVVREIEEAGRRDVLIVDDNLFINRTHATALFQALVPLKIRWGCQVSIDIADDPRLLDLMAESGCMAALVGFESLDPLNLQQMNKAWTLRHVGARVAVDRFHDRGIMVYGSFIFGYDADTPERIDETVAFAIDARIFLANISPLTPMPGSRLYERLRSEGRLLYERWWLDDRYRYGDVVFRPALMDPDGLAARCIAARQAFYASSAIARRLTNIGANARSLRHLALFIGANLVSRRELSTKLGRPLGALERGVSSCESTPVPLSFS